jgi:uncharacterized protein YkwD
LVAAHNANRASGERGELAELDALNAAAQLHACDMARTGNFSHTGSGNSTHTDRIRSQGGRCRRTSENIAWGKMSLGSLMNGRMNSAGHNRNIMDRKVQRIGIGVAYRGDTPYWVAVMGGRC